MKRYLTMAVVAAMGLAFAPASTSLETAAQQQEDIELARTVTVDRVDAKSAEWTSDPFAGVAPNFFAGSTTGTPYECNDTVEGNCEYSLIEFVGITDDEVAAADEAGKLGTLKANGFYRIGITNYSVPVSDLDIILWKSNADGEKLGEITRVGELDTDPSEEAQGSLSFSGANPKQYILLEVVYFAGAGTYDGYVNYQGGAPTS